MTSRRSADSSDGTRDSAPTVLVTGATDGLGRALVGELARRGVTVLAHGRNAAKLETLAADLGPRVQPLLADLASLAQVRSLAVEVTARTARLHALVNNAGVGFGAPGAAREVSADGHELRFAVNYLAPVLLTRELTPLLARSAPARVVQVGSIGQRGFDPADPDAASFARDYDGTTAYRRAKLALAAYTVDSAPELLRRGIAMNCVHPATLMDTTMVRATDHRPQSTLDDGLRAVLPLVLDPAWAERGGEFLDGPHVSRALDLAYDPDFRAALRATTDRLLAWPGLPDGVDRHRTD